MKGRVIKQGNGIESALWLSCRARKFRFKAANHLLVLTGVPVQGALQYLHAN